MKRILAATIGTAAFLLAIQAQAGVVLVQQETMNGTGAGNTTTTRTVSVEGNRQRTVDSRQTMIVDLDKGTAVILNPEKKTATEMSFPMKGPMGMMMQSMANIALNFKSAGSQKTIAGFKCSEYKGEGNMPMGTYSSLACFSKDAPGAAEYAGFYRKFASKLGVAPASMANLPDGVPLSMEVTVKTAMPAMAGLPPEQAKAMAQMMANRGPIVTTTTVTSIKTASLSADTFAVPADYKKQQMQMPDFGALSGKASR